MGKSITITAPVSTLHGERGGLHFSEGKATADSEKHEAAIAYFLQAGYTVEGLDAPDETVPDITPLDKMRKADLITLAAERGVTVPAGANVDAIRALLSGKDAADAHEPESQVNPDADPANTPTPESAPPAGTVHTTTPAAAGADNTDAQGVQH